MTGDVVVSLSGGVGSWFAARTVMTETGESKVFGIRTAMQQTGKADD